MQEPYTFVRIALAVLVVLLIVAVVLRRSGKLSDGMWAMGLLVFGLGIPGCVYFLVFQPYVPPK